MDEPSELVRRLSAELQRASSALDTVLNTLPIGIGVAEDPECREIRVNRAFAEQLGIRRDQNASMSAPDPDRPPFRLLIGGTEPAPEDLPMQTAARTGAEVGPVECDVLQADGRRVTLYEYASPLFDADGRIRGAVGVFVDITDRRRVEQENRFLAQASEILSASLDYEETLASLAKLAVPVLADLCAVDVLLDDRTVNRVEVVIAGAERQPLAAALGEFPPLPAVDSPFTQVLRTGKPVMITGVAREALERAAHSPEHAALLARLGVRDLIVAPLTARGHTLGLLSLGLLDPPRRYSGRDLEIAVDVARRAALALDNALLYRRAQDANRLKEDFLATLSHELRTPLNALLGWTQLLKARADEEEFRERAIENIERNANAQAVLINDLLDVSRVVTGKLVLAFQPVDLEAVLLAAVDSMRPAAEARGVELALVFAPLPGTVVGDADRLQQVFWNLLSNAVKFTPAAGRVEVALAPRDGAAEVSVTDTGAGIDPAFLPHVFERFRQADSTTTRGQGGLGIGLAIVRQLVDLHGGAVTAESDGEGRGSRFTVRLPLRDHPAADAATGGDAAARALRRSPAGAAPTAAAGERGGRE